MKNKLDSLLFHKANIVRFTILCRSATYSIRTIGSLCTRAKKEYKIFFAMLLFARASSAALQNGGLL